MKTPYHISILYWWLVNRDPYDLPCYKPPSFTGVGLHSSEKKKTKYNEGSFSWLNSLCPDGRTSWLSKIHRLHPRQLQRKVSTWQQTAEPKNGGGGGGGPFFLGGGKKNAETENNMVTLEDGLLVDSGCNRISLPPRSFFFASKQSLRLSQLPRAIFLPSPAIVGSNVEFPTATWCCERVKPLPDGPRGESIRRVLTDFFWSNWIPKS